MHHNISTKYSPLPLPRCVILADRTISCIHEQCMEPWCIDWRKNKVIIVIIHKKAVLLQGKHTIQRGFCLHQMTFRLLLTFTP